MKELIQIKWFFSNIILISSSAQQTLYNCNCSLILLYTYADKFDEK